MKKVIYSALMLGALAFSTTSCTKTCDAGYEGSDCKTEVRAKFLGNYKVGGTAVTTGGGSAPITDLIVTVTSSSVGVENFNFAYTIGGDQYSLAAVLGSDGVGFNVPSQTSQGLTYSGTGSFTSSTMTVQLLEVDGSTNTTINLTGPKN